MPTTGAKHPNIILITCHDLGRWLDCYGRAPMGTPNLDRLAAEGVRFSNHFCTCPSCSPSRGSIVTGRYPHSNGLVGLVNLGWDLPESEKPLPRLLGDAGYQTVLCGVQHEHHEPTALGYQKVHRGGKAAQAVSSAIEELRSSPAEPFYMAVGTNEPHRRFHSAEMQPETDAPVPDYLPDCDGVRREMAGFRKLVQALDDNIGRLLAALDETGLAEKTWVIFTTDHGIDMPRAKGTLYDPGIETALIMRWPGKTAAGQTNDALLSNVDLAPTLLDMLDLPHPEDVQGRSYAPLLRGDDYREREHIFAEKTHHVLFDPMRCVRTRRMKYIDNITPLRKLEIPASGEMDVEAIVPDLCKLRRPRTELYDLDADPGETVNVAGKPEYAEAEQALRDRLRAWQEETDDFLLRGQMPLPPRES